MVIAEYGAEGDRDWRRVIVDPGAGTVTFQRCHQVRRFLSAGADPESTCRLSEVRGLCRNAVPGVGRVLEVVTPTGRARLPEAADGFEGVRAALLGGLGPGAGLRWYEYPAAGGLLAPVVLAVAVVTAGLLIRVVEAVRLPDRPATGVLLGVMAAVAVAAGVLRWRGRSQW